MKAICPVISLLILCLAGEALSDCTVIPPVKEFREDHKLGQWYLLAASKKTPDDKPYFTCERMYVYKDGTKWILTGNGLDSSQHRIANWTETGHMTETPGHFDYVNPTEGAFSLTVIEEGDHHLLLYSCNLPKEDHENVWLYHRNDKTNLDTLPEAEKKEITDELNNHHIEMSSLQIFDNSHCE